MRTYKVMKGWNAGCMSGYDDWKSFTNLEEARKFYKQANKFFDLELVCADCNEPVWKQSDECECEVV